MVTDLLLSHYEATTLISASFYIFFVVFLAVCPYLFVVGINGEQVGGAAVSVLQPQRKGLEENAFMRRRSPRHSRNILA